MSNSVVKSVTGLPPVVTRSSNGEDKATLLLVEDNEWVQNYVRKIFRSMYEVHVAGDGIDALHILKDVTPDVLILDIMMPRMDGNELFARLKENEEWAHIPIIMFSALSSEEQRLEGLEKGADDYIGKPFNPRELVARTRNLLQLRQQEKELKQLNEDLEQRVQAQVSIILSQRERYETELITAKEKAEESDQLKSFILKNMSHEIRTPITNILGFTEILSERVQREDEQFISYIENNGKRLLDTVTTILDFSKLTTDNFSLNPTTVDIVEIAGDAVTRFTSLASEKELTIVADTGDEPQLTQLDRVATDTILNHIIGNAVKFTENGGIIVRASASDGHVQFEVEDTGVGIGDDFLEELFSPFKQESVGESRSFEGTGLGLSICKRLVELIGGEIHVDSRKGQGSTFRVVLPVDEANNAHGDRRPAQSRATLKPLGSSSSRKV